MLDTYREAVGFSNRVLIAFSEIPNRRMRNASGLPLSNVCRLLSAAETLVAEVII